MKSSSFLARLTAWQLRMRSSPFRTRGEVDEVDVTDMDYLVAGIPIATALGALAWFLLVPATKPPPPASFVACFTAAMAPSVQFEGERIRPRQSKFGAQRYRFVLQKYGTLSIDADPGLMLRQARDGGYVFVSGRPPYSNSTMTLLHEVNGKLYPVFKPGDAEFLSVDLDTGDAVTFERANSANCGLR